MTSLAPGIRPASNRLFAGGTTSSWVPHTTSVGALMAPSNGMLDQVENANECHTTPQASAAGLPSRGRTEAAENGSTTARDRADAARGGDEDEPAHPAGCVTASC